MKDSFFWWKETIFSFHRRTLGAKRFWIFLDAPRVLISARSFLSLDIIFFQLVGPKPLGCSYWTDQNSASVRLTASGYSLVSSSIPAYSLTTSSMITVGMKTSFMFLFQLVGVIPWLYFNIIKRVLSSCFLVLIEFFSRASRKIIEVGMTLLGIKGEAFLQGVLRGQMRFMWGYT